MNVNKLMFQYPIYVCLLFFQKLARLLLTLLYFNFPKPGTPTITLTLLYVNVPIPGTPTITLTLLYVNFPKPGTPTITLRWLKGNCPIPGTHPITLTLLLYVSFPIQIAQMCSHLLHGVLQYNTLYNPSLSYLEAGIDLARAPTGWPMTNKTKTTDNQKTVGTY